MSRPLFGSSILSRGSTDGNRHLVEFRAGRMFLSGTLVTADLRKGLVYLYRSEDTLVHFWYSSYCNIQYLLTCLLTSYIAGKIGATVGPMKICLSSPMNAYSNASPSAQLGGCICWNSKRTIESSSFGCKKWVLPKTNNCADVLTTLWTMLRIVRLMR